MPQPSSRPAINAASASTDTRASAVRCRWAADRFRSPCGSLRAAATPVGRNSAMQIRLTTSPPAAIGKASLKCTSAGCISRAALSNAIIAAVAINTRALVNPAR